MKILIIIGICGILMGEITGIMLKIECPYEEIHKSCSFSEEYICWSGEDRLNRVKLAPKKLHHCISGCFCKKGYVREYPKGGCIVTAGCRNQQIRDMLDKLPISTGLYITEGIKRF